MGSLTFDYLSHTLQRAKELDYQFVGVQFEIEGFLKPEIIINQVDDFESLLVYYKKTFNENLNHKFIKGKKVSAFTFGNSFSEIEKYLLG